VEPNTSPRWPSARAGEAAAGKERDESRVGAIGVPLGIDREVDEVHVAHGIRPFQPVERRHPVAEAGWMSAMVYGGTYCSRERASSEASNARASLARPARASV
jgi:hypothetical protein